MTTTCTWTEIGDEDDFWETACDNAFCFMTGGPKENEMKFCPYCGRPIEVVAYVDDDDHE